MDGTCISPELLTAVAAMVSALFGALVWSFRDSVREARAERDRALNGWEQTIGLGEKVVRREQRKR